VSAAHQVIETGYRPRPLQAELHRRLRRFNAVVCHRRFGKTVCFVNEKIDRGLRFEKFSHLDHKPFANPQYAYLAPTYGQAKRIAWEYLKQYTEKLPGFSPNEADLRVDIARPGKPGERIRFILLGAENVGSLKGLYLDGAILDEYAEMNPVVWREAIRPALSDRLGWAIFGGTPKGSNHFKEVYDYAKAGTDQEWFAALYRADETGIIPAAELESARRTMSPEEFEQEYLCSFSGGMVGAYFTAQLADAEKQGRLTRVQYDEALPLQLFWDLGANDVTAVWFVQPYGNTFRVIDYDEAPDLSIPEWCRRTQDKGYKIDDDYLPHDAAARDLSTGVARADTFRKARGKKPNVVPRVADKLDSIAAARQILGRCYFDREKCERGLKALGEYRRKWDEKSKAFSPKPLHNWASNGADAFQQLAMVAIEDRGFERTTHLSPQAESSWDVFA
jgi:hypothetical protein